MTMNEIKEVAATPDDAQLQAFYARVNQLYQMYEDWTGERDEEETGAADDAAPPASRKQSNGQSCITAVEALSTLAVFTARLAVDFEMDREDFMDTIGTMYDNERAQDEDEEEAGAEGRAEPS